MTAENPYNLLPSFLTLCITGLLSSTLFKWKIHQKLIAWLKGKNTLFSCFPRFWENILCFPLPLYFALKKKKKKDEEIYIKVSNAFFFFLNWKSLVCDAAVSWVVSIGLNVRFEDNV